MSAIQSPHQRPESSPADEAFTPNPFASLSHAIEHAAHLLPAQGPITVFIHHNTLHAFEDLPFTQAVKRAAKLFGCQPYLTEDRFREELRKGRIQFADLASVLRLDLGEWAGESVLRLCTRLDLRLAMLQYPLRFGPTEELLWFVAETQALRRIRDDASSAVRGRLIAETRRWVMRDLRGGNEARRNGHAHVNRSKDAALFSLLERFGGSHIESWSEEEWEAFTLQTLWRVCCDGVSGAPDLVLPPLLPLRHRDLLLAATGIDSDPLVHGVLIPFCGAFVDQGLAHWQLPQRHAGFYQSFCELYGKPGGPPDAWRRPLAKELGRLMDQGIGPLESIHESLELLGVPECEWKDYLAATLLPLRGWGGIVRFLEERPDRAVQPIPPGSLVEFLAIRLVLDRLAVEHAAKQALAFTGPLAALRDELREQIAPAKTLGVEQRAFLVFQLAQVLGWTPGELHRLDDPDWATLMEEIESFSSMERRRVLHLAYEHRFYRQTLDALSLHNEAAPVRSPATAVPRFQAMFCIDEREESLRRHVEELAPDAVTFGIAGFYFVDMYYRGSDDAHFVPLCPAVMRPGHWVVENVDEGLEGAFRRRAKTRRALGMASHHLHAGSRTFALGALLSAAGGVLASIPLITRTLFPRLAARFREALGKMVFVPPATRLQLDRSESPPGPENGHVGYTLDEMVAIAERVLRDTGLTANFSRIVLTLGHGSTTMNNPHGSAYDCGACGGARGGPNGRAIAQILNDSRVRDRLSAIGLVVPLETVFVGGMHNTSNDTITYFDLDLLPDSHKADFEDVRALMDQARDRNAHERCRRFLSAPLNLTFAAAAQHVEGRTEDLAQVRPECGHATNAICIIGRRERTRGLFLDRRAFLNSYDPTQDDENATILTRILQAAVPVCAGISLEYYFSYVDNAGYGSGTKLPHNVAALLGVMDGAASDLRTGLPWQMVEIHEPVRILFVVETTPSKMLRVLERNPGLGRLVKNGWFRLATLSPDSCDVHQYHNGAFHNYVPQAAELPWAGSSVDWYRGWRDHLEFAQIGEGWSRDRRD